MCCIEYLEAHLNTEFPHEPESMPAIPTPPPDAKNQAIMTEWEIQMAIANMKNKESPGERYHNR